MQSFHQIRAGIIGGGFIGPVHMEALRRLGVQVTAIGGSKSCASLAKQWNIPEVYPDKDIEGLLNSDQVDVVHITSPNRHHSSQAFAALDAGKHVICEKPLAMNAEETSFIWDKSRRLKKQIFAVNYNVRFYPAVLQLRDDIQNGHFGKIIHVNGSYFQDWLLKPTDYNWRLFPKEGGALRAVADIGTHWMDTVTFILGARISELYAHLGTFHKTRQRPVGELTTFSNEAPAETKPYRVKTEDFASIMLQFQNGAHGNLAVSQVAAGRKNSIRIEIYGSEQSAWWDSERPNEIQYGSRDERNGVALRNAAGFQDSIQGFTDYPAGHNEGFTDTFKMLYRSVYQDILNGPSKRPLYATAEDGHAEVRLCEAVLESSKSRQWIKVSR
ncbi:MAG: Gfo/Idh/MocA family oxidoreductase [Verrucomicrobia bacterium]|jgi:predicted dehydrogenase|nr:Gfo/Idh/MocA family oxidoreductase [Verrucomicrobiota bacterium]